MPTRVPPKFTGFLKQGLRIRAGIDRCVLTVAPFGPRAVVVLDVVIAQQPRDEISHRLSVLPSGSGHRPPCPR